ncbi:hypothetical protein NARC_40099 [Candidatus Nitrosocosmicus arcticus]|uniref:Uncharacterized protein n=1 Tax=Candidatus Nitrosocosmicus arcticus TaxID=2035267 RepID=A0A557SWZ9_9ARCH|nr:hypothetical protein NARC_40099 [Candidatus Nitrosocosmicus arcticus]
MYSDLISFDIKAKIILELEIMNSKSIESQHSKPNSFLEFIFFSI